MNDFLTLLFIAIPAVYVLLNFINIKTFHDLPQKKVSLIRSTATWWVQIAPAAQIVLIVGAIAGIFNGISYGAPVGVRIFAWLVGMILSAMTAIAALFWIQSKTKFSIEPSKSTNDPDVVNAERTIRSIIVIAVLILSFGVTALGGNAVECFVAKTLYARQNCAVFRMPMADLKETYPNLNDSSTRRP